MCLTIRLNTYNESHLKHRRKAVEDIQVFKILRKEDKKYFAPIWNLEYKKGYLYYQKGKKFGISKDGLDIKINAGLHSFSTRQDATNYTFLGKDEVIVEMVVPKGSVFYTRNGYICSDQLWFK